jgi:hypothetical protein
MEVAESAAGLLIYKELDYSKHKVKSHIIYLKANTERTTIVVHFENN